jgi:hypothetical protein
MSLNAQPSWRTYGEAARLWLARPTLRKTIKIALVVGTLLSLINQGSVIFGGHATAVTCVRVGLNYLVPFCVSSLGYLSATPRAGTTSGEGHIVRRSCVLAAGGCDVDTGWTRT